MYAIGLVRRAAGELRRIVRAETPTHGELRDRIMGLLIVSVAVDLICAALSFWFEHGQPMTQLKSYGSALFWTSTQLLTVSSQIQNPTSAPGRILDIGMEAYAITVVGTMAGSIGAFMLRRARDQEREAGAK